MLLHLPARQRRRLLAAPTDSRRAGRVEYEIVKHGYGKSEKSRADVVKLSGQKYLPVLELPDGSVHREETDDMVAKVKSGELPSAAG